MGDHVDGCQDSDDDYINVTAPIYRAIDRLEAAAYAKGREDQRKVDVEIAGKVILDPAHSGPCDSHGICDSCTIKHEITEAIERGGEK